jgi:hypothetical protein
MTRNQTFLSILSSALGLVALWTLGLVSILCSHINGVIPRNRDGRRRPIITHPGDIVKYVP